MPATPFRFAEHPVAAALAPWLGRYWEFAVEEGAPPIHHVPPDGCTSILLPITPEGPGPLLLSGPWLEPFSVPVAPGSRYVGVRCTCGGGAPFLRVDADALVGRTQPAAPFLGPLAAELAGALSGTTSLAEASGVMDRLFLPLATERETPHPLIGRFVARVLDTRGDLSIALFCKEIGTSERTLLRHFKAGTGITPKQFARIQRLRFAALAMLTDEELSRIAAERGYADQPHLQREFVDLIGLTPTALRRVIRATRHDDLTT